MKRMMAWLLCIVFMISSLPSMPILGAITSEGKCELKQSTIEVGEQQKEATITFGTNALELIEKKVSSDEEDREVTVQWKIGDKTKLLDGTYTLNYYASKKINNKDEFYKINLEFQVGQKYDENNELQPQDNFMGVKINVVDYDQAVMKRRVTPYKQENMAPENPYNQQLTHNIDILSKIPSERELVVDIDGISDLKMFVKDNQIFLSVTGIGKDYITPFHLEYNRGGNLPEEIIIFKGLSTFSILPTHLVEYAEEGKTVDSKEIGLPSQHVIDLVDKGTDSFVEPGSKPGIVIKMSKPKKIEEVAGKLQAVPISGEDPHEVHLRLGELLSSEIGMDEKTAMKIEFQLYGGATLRDTRTKKEAKVYENGDFLELYFVQDKETASVAPENKQYLMEWSYLKSGMLIDSELELAGQTFGNNLYYNLNKPGYTYINYDLNRMSEKNMVIELQPYNIQNKVNYGLFRKRNSSATESPVVEPILDTNWNALEKRYHTINQSQPKISFTTEHQSTNERYLVTMSYLTMTFFSQIIQYSGENTNVPPPYPEITNIENTYVITDSFIDKEDGVSSNQLAIGTDLMWKCPADTQDMNDVKAYLQSGKIYYEFYLSQDAQKETDRLIGVVEASLDKQTNSDKILLKPYAGKILGEVTYNEKSNQYVAQGLVLKDKSSNNWMTLQMPDRYEQQTSYPAQSEIIQSTEITSNSLPGTYYITVRAVYEKHATEADSFLLGVSDPSNPKAISLDYTQKVLPTTDYITSEPLEQQLTSRKTWFKAVDLKDYVRLMIDPLGYKLYKEGEAANLKYRRIYEVYFSQSKMDDTNQRILDPNRIKEIEYSEEDHIPTVNLDDALKKDLRDEQKILKLEVESLENNGGLIPIVWNNLEPNTAYYIKVVTKIEVYEEERIGTVKSLYSKTHTFTTDTKPLPPGIDEQAPPVPEAFNIIGEVKDTYVKLGWQAPTYEQDKENQIYYEIIRTIDTPLPEEVIKLKSPLETIIDQSSRYKGFHTAHYYLEKYEKGVWSRQQPEQLSGFTLEENTLLPNKVYYYYIRTVYTETTNRGETGKVVGDKAYSQWVILPVTTSPVGRPLQLAIEPQSQTLSYDGQHETVISFIAPIPAGSVVPTDFSFDLSIKDTQTGEEYVIAIDGTQGKSPYTVKRLKEEAYSTQYRFFMYQISGLTHGTRYDIKVRVVDKTGEEISQSLYSDKVSVRTDFSEEDQDQENAFNQYLEQYDKEAQKLKYNPYWIVDEKTSQQTYKYRKSYISSELASFKTYALVADATTDSVYYYLPSTFFEETLKNNTLITIKLGDYTATLRAGTLKNNETLLQAKEQIESGRYKDYYIGLTFSLVERTSKISGLEMISPEIIMQMEVVYVNQQDLEIEDTILEQLNEQINAGRKDVIWALERYVVNGKIDEDRLSSIIEDTLSDIAEKHHRQIAKLLGTKIKKYTNIDTIQLPIYLEASVSTYEVQGYYFNKDKWETIYVTNIGGKVSFEMNQLGSYGLTGKQSSNVLLPDIAGGSQLISKYQLTEFFDIERGLNQTMTKEKVYGTLAKVLGARQGTDYVLYLKNRGIKLIVPNTPSQPIRQDEAIYMIMQAYEKMYYKNVNAFTISNKLGVSNIGAFQPQYRAYIYAAVELNVVVPENNKVLPSKLPTVKDIIRMLTKIVPN